MSIIKSNSKLLALHNVQINWRIPTMVHKYLYACGVLFIVLSYGVQIANASTIQIGNPAPGYIDFNDLSINDISDFSLTYEGGTRDPSNSDISNLIEDEGRITVLSLNDFWLGDDGKFYSNLWVYDFDKYSVSNILDYDTYEFSILPVRHIPEIPEIPDNPSVIPIPAAAFLFVSGLFGLVGFKRLKKWFTIQFKNLAVTMG
jgi:hypothetical protein